MNFKNLPLTLFFICTGLGTVPLLAQGDSCSVAFPLSVPGEVTLNLIADGPATGTGTTLTFGDQKSADWYVFTAPADGVISISSCGGGSDTYLRVHTGTCDSLELAGESDDACDADLNPNNKNNILASNLPALFVRSGMTYYVEWAGIWSTDPFSWTLSFTQAQADGSPIGGVPFTQVPIQQAQGGIPISARIRSNGPGTLSGASIQARILDFNSMPVTQGSIGIPNLEADSTQEVNIFTWNGAVEGSYEIEYIISGGNNGFAGNDTLRVDLDVSSVTYAMDRATSPGFGEVTLADLTQGQLFDFFAADTIRVVSALLLGGNPGEDVQIQVYAFTDDRPGALVAESNRITLTESAPGKVFFDLEQEAGGFPVAPGSTYLFALTHFNPGNSNIFLGKTEELFFPGRTWIRSRDNDWIQLEDIGTEQTMAIQLSNDFRAQQLTVSVDMQELALNEELAGQVSLLWKTADSDPQLTPMIPMPDSTYEASIPVKSLDEVFYVFVNGDGSAAEQYETVPGACGQSTSFFGSPLLARQATMGFSDQEVDIVCFGSCEACNGFPCGSATTIICDDIESYNLGEIGPQSTHWTNLFDSAEGLVISGGANSGEQAMLVDGTISGQDILLLLGNQTQGAYELSWRMYKPGGKKAYYNIQHDQDFGNFAGVVFFFEGGVGNFRINPDEAELTEFTFPEEAWFEVRHVFDLDQNQARLYIDGKAVYAWDFSIGTAGNTNQLGSINFFPFNLDYRYFVDDIFFQGIESNAANDICFFNTDISGLLGGAMEVPQLSALQDNRNAGSDSFDPLTGTDCFADAPNSLDNSLWYSFVGDGQRYQFQTVPCNAATYASNTQLAMYAGMDCQDLQAVDCNEGGTEAGNLILETQEGQNYYLLVDGFNAGGVPTSGEFCLEVTQTDDITSTTRPAIVEQVQLFPNPASDWVTLFVELESPEAIRLQLFNLNGQQVWAKQYLNPIQRLTEQIELSNLPTGFYQLRMQVAGETFTSKLVVK